MWHAISKINPNEDFKIKKPEGMPKIIKHCQISQNKTIVMSTIQIKKNVMTASVKSECAIKPSNNVPKIKNQHMKKFLLQRI